MVEPVKKDKDTLLKKEVGKDQGKTIPSPPEPDLKTLKLPEGYKSWEEVGKAVIEKEKQIGKMGTDIGDLRKSTKEQSELIKGAAEIIKGISEDGKVPDTKLSPTQVNAFLQDLYSDPVGVMGAIARQETSGGMKELKSSIEKIADILQRKDILEASPKIKDLPEEIQDAVVKDKTGKLREYILKLQEKEPEKDTPPVIKPPGMITPGPTRKVISSEEEAKQILEDAIKEKDPVKASQVIAALLGK